MLPFTLSKLYTLSLFTPLMSHSTLADIGVYQCKVSFVIESLLHRIIIVTAIIGSNLLKPIFSAIVSNHTNITR